MGDMGEIFKLANAIIKQERAERNAKYEPKLIELGATKKSMGVYELDEWFCYPTKGFCMNKQNNKKRMSLERLIWRQKNERRANNKENKL